MPETPALDATSGAQEVKDTLQKLLHQLLQDYEDLAVTEDIARKQQQEVNASSQHIKTILEKVGGIKTRVHYGSLIFFIDDKKALRWERIENSTTLYIEPKNDEV